MDNLKYFLDNVCKHSEQYHYVQVDCLAELYRKNDPLPIVIVEWVQERAVFDARFRIGLSAVEVASISRDMSIQNSSLNFIEDFIIDPDYGYVYGKDAAKIFFKRIQDKLEKKDDIAEIKKATFVSPKPIFTFGSGSRSKTKLEKMWREDGEI